PRTRDKDFPTKYIFRWLPLGWPFFHTSLGPKAASQPSLGQRSREKFDRISHCAVVIPAQARDPPYGRGSHKVFAQSSLTREIPHPESIRGSGLQRVGLRYLMR